MDRFFGIVYTPEFFAILGRLPCWYLEGRFNVGTSLVEYIFKACACMLWNLRNYLILRWFWKLFWWGRACWENSRKVGNWRSTGEERMACGENYLVNSHLLPLKLEIISLSEIRGGGNWWNSILTRDRNDLLNLSVKLLLYFPFQEKLRDIRTFLRKLFSMLRICSVLDKWCNILNIKLTAII